MQAKTIERLDKEWMKQARTLGLLDQKHFIQALNEYNRHMDILEDMGKSIKENGSTIVVPVGKDKEKTITNPVVSDMLRVEKSAQSLRKELDDKMDKATIEYKKAEAENVSL